MKKKGFREMANDNEFVNHIVVDRLKVLHVNGMSFTSPEIADILLPTQKFPYWQIELRIDGSVVYATGNITVICAPK
ncbi:MAG: hypothetical protein ABSA46_01625 [Thermodesulfovibrionales bacterium]|jgi:hypothetical protein